MSESPWAEVLAGIGALILLGIRLGYSHLRKLLEHAAAKQSQKLEKIEGEFSNNGGSSLRDAVDRIENSVSANTGRIWGMLADARSARWETDAKGDYTYMNRTGLRWTGRPFSDIRGRGWINAVAPEDRDRVVAEWFKAERSESLRDRV